MRKKVLFVDDDEGWRKRVGASFAQAGYETMMASDATQALELAQQNQFGVIVLDIYLDGEDGVMLLKFLRRNHPGVPVLLFSALGHDQAAIRAMLDKGADQYLPKGNSMDELIVTVGSYLNA